eukprot:2574311-Amphidinium_carterae.5
MELLLRREHVLQTTLHSMQVLQHRGSHPQTQSRYYTDDAEQEQEWNEDTEFDTYFGNNDDDWQSETGYSTTSSQWADENLRDPWGAERISQEYMAAQADPAYAVKLYWAARRAVRRHRAAAGRFGRRSHFRRRKGKGKGKRKGKSKFPSADSPFSTAPILSTGGGKSKKGKSKGKSGGLFWTHDEENWQEDNAWTSEAWYGDDEYAYDIESYPVSDGKGKSKSKGKGKDTCHICGKPGHWKNECPMRSTMFAETPNEVFVPSTEQHAARGVHFATSHSNMTPNIASTHQSLPGAVYITQESEQLIELGEELPGDEVPEPFYMAVTDHPEQSTHPAAAPTEEAETTDDAEHADSDSEYITVQGTLQVEGRLRITSKDKATNRTSTASSSSHNTAARKALQQLQLIQPKSTATTTAPTSSHAPSSKPAASPPVTRDDGKTEYVIDLTSLFGSKLILGEGAAVKRQRSSISPSAAPATIPLAMPATHSATGSKPSSDEEFQEFHGFVMATDADAGEDTYPVFQMDCVSTTNDENTYKVSHCRAQLEDCPSLLPDSGAVENLVGANTAKRLAEFSKRQALDKGINHAGSDYTVRRPSQEWEEQRLHRRIRSSSSSTSKVA